MGVGNQHRAPAAFTGVWLGFGAGLDRCGNLASTGVLSPDLAARSESLYRLRHADSKHSNSAVALKRDVEVQSLECLADGEVNSFLYPPFPDGHNVTIAGLDAVASVSTNIDCLQIRYTLETGRSLLTFRKNMSFPAE